MLKMKRFLIEVISAVCLIFMAGFLFYRTNIPSSISKRIQKTEEKLEIINLGTSHGSNFDYRDCALNGLRINKAANTVYYDLQNYLYLNNQNYLSEDALIIIPVSYFAFGLDENRSDRYPNKSFVNEYYYYLPTDQIFSFSMDKKVRLTILNIQDNFQDLIESEEVQIKKKKKPINITDSTLNSQAISRVKHHRKLGEFSSQKSYRYLETLIEEIISNNHTPILVATPYHYSYNENFGKDWLNIHYFSIMKDLSVKYNITYLDYSHDERLVCETNYFANSDHLNPEGRKVFSSILFNDLGIHK
jgi:hypothetical protein